VLIPKPQLTRAAATNRHFIGGFFEIERLLRNLRAFRRIFSRIDRLELVFIAFIYFVLVIETLRQQC